MREGALPLRCYTWPPCLVEGMSTSLHISVPQQQGVQRFSELHVQLEDEALDGAALLDVCFPTAHTPCTQTLTVLVDPRETGTGHIRLRIAAAPSAGGAAGAEGAAGEQAGSLPTALQGMVYKLPLICLPSGAAAELSALFDGVVRARLAQQPPQQAGDEQHMVVARAHAEVIRPILKDLAVILRENPPYHKLKPACDRLSPLLLSFGMPHCLAVVRGWLAMLEEPVEPAHLHSTVPPEFWQARMEGTDMTLGQTIDADYPSSQNSVESLAAYELDALEHPEWGEQSLPDHCATSATAGRTAQQHTCVHRHEGVSRSHSSGSSASDVLLTSFMPEQEVSCRPHLLGVSPSGAASAACSSDEEEGASVERKMRRCAHGAPHAYGLPAHSNRPDTTQAAQQQQQQQQQQQVEGSKAGSPQSAEQPAQQQGSNASSSPAKQLRGSPLAVLLSGFKGTASPAAEGAGAAQLEQHEYCNGYEQRYMRHWAARFQGLDASALVLMLLMILVLLPWSLATDNQKQRRTSVGLLLLQAVPVLLSAVMTVHRPQGMEKHRDRITVLSRAVSATLLASFCMVPVGQALPSALLRVAHSPLLLRAAFVVFQNAYRAVLLKNVLLVSLVECLALGWVSVCAGTPLVPSLMHALALWAVAVFSTALVDASSRRSFSRAMLRGQDPGAVRLPATKAELFAAEEQAADKKAGKPGLEAKEVPTVQQDEQAAAKADDVCSYRLPSVRAPLLRSPFATAECNNWASLDPHYCYDSSYGDDELEPSSSDELLAQEMMNMGYDAHVPMGRADGAGFPHTAAHFPTHFPAKGVAGAECRVRQRAVFSGGGVTTSV